MTHLVSNHLISGFKGSTTDLKAMWGKDLGETCEEEKWSRRAEEMLRPVERSTQLQKSIRAPEEEKKTRILRKKLEF